jgi:hypothetical protein
MAASLRVKERPLLPSNTVKTQCSGIKLGHPVPGGYKYGNLALQIGGVSDETVKYGREF